MHPHVIVTEQIAIPTGKKLTQKTEIVLDVDDLRLAPRADELPLHLDAAYDLCLGDGVGELICG